MVEDVKFWCPKCESRDVFRCGSGGWYLCLKCGFWFHVDGDDGWVVKREGCKVFMRSGEALFECPYCRDENKVMLFVCEADLMDHVSAFHRGEVF